MNRASVRLAILAGLMMLMLTGASVSFLAGAGYLALAAHMSPWLAALFVAGLLLLPLLLILARLSWSARRKRVQQHRFDAFKAAFVADARKDPYGIVGTAFMSGIMLSTSPATRGRIVEYMAAFKGMRSS